MFSDNLTIVKTAKEFLQRNKISFLSISNPVFYSKSNKDNVHRFDYWVTSYVYKVFQEEDAFIYIDDATQKIMYVLTKHGKDYVNGISEPVEMEEDEENWDDL